MWEFAGNTEFQVIRPKLKLCVSTKFSHQKICCNFGISHGALADYWVIIASAYILFVNGSLLLIWNPFFLNYNFGIVIYNFRKLVEFKSERKITVLLRSRDIKLPCAPTFDTEGLFLVTPYFVLDYDLE